MEARTSRAPRERRVLVATLEVTGALRTAAVRDAFLTVPREAFLPHTLEEAGLAGVYADEAIRAKADAHGGWISSSSQPTVMAEMLEALQLAPGQRVLEIGTGTGYNAALLASLVSPGGRVRSVEVEPDLAEGARAALAGVAADVEVATGDGRLGHAPDAPYDRIIATVAARDVPVAWRDQLRDGGLLVLPLHLSADASPQAIVALRREGDVLRSRSVFAGAFMSLRDAPDAPAPTDPTLSAEDTAGRPFVLLSGQALAALPRNARRRLLTLLLGAPRRRRVPFRAERHEAFALHAFVALSAARAAQASRWPAYGTVLLAPDGRGAALLRTSADGSTRIDAYGDEACERELVREVARWEALGRPGLEQLRVTVRFDGSDPEAWRVLRPGSSTVALDRSRG